MDGTPQQFAQLSTSIREMAKEMPSSAVEIAHVAEAAGQLGVPIGAIKDFSKTMINLGVSTNLSSEEAASSIAKIGNIMQVSGKDLGTWSGHFGSAVVDLGNHFATTERDIVEMTNRLAAGGKLAGLTTPEILGLATAMSSVGIEAEAGGTAMTQTLTGIGKAVSGVGKGAKEKLEVIAQTAGMTAEQFSTAWKQKPAEALQAFIKGLQRAHDEGKNMDGILDELGMTGIRQGNMLKSLASASDQMGEAVRRSNSAWKENSALTNEASKRYETTESQLKIFKNKLTDIAIEFGGPLLKALNSGLDAAKPWLQTLSDMAKKFSEMSTEQQQNIIKWGAMAAAIGPALKLFGGAASVIGGFAKGLGTIAKGIGTFSGTLKTISNGGGFING
ncbi:phage tail tape measure protein [Streptococcus parasanguinis]|nr:phage tail tape measure protein [Streptococcus parasanguinis]